jgi:3-oxoacyl-[acyl-carrier-protein] synthase-3
VETDEKVGVLASALHADGALAQDLMTEAPASRENPRISAEMLAARRHYPVMDGKGIFKNAVRRLPEVCREALAKVEMKVADIDLFLPHQANLRINQAFARAIEVADEKVYNNIQRYGNTTAASIPLALDEALEKGIVGSGSTVMFIGLGAGLTWGAVIYRFARNFR